MMTAAMLIGVPGAANGFARHAEIRSNHVKWNPVIKLGKVVNKIFVPLLGIVT